MNAEYQRGYKAGRKKSAYEEAMAQSRLIEATAEVSRRRHEVVCAVLQGMLAAARPWHANGKPVRTLDEYIALARQFADATVPSA